MRSIVTLSGHKISVEARPLPSFAAMAGELLMTVDGKPVRLSKSDVTALVADLLAETEEFEASKNGGSDG